MRRITSIAIIVLLLLTLAACAKSSAIRDASIDELHNALGKSDTVLVDVRKGSALGTDLTFIKGAMQIPLHTLSSNLGKIRKDANVYIIGSKQSETNKAANMLAEAGYPYIFRVTEGFDAYVMKYPPK